MEAYRCSSSSSSSRSLEVKKNGKFIERDAQREGGGGYSSPPLLSSHIVDGK